MDIIYFYLYITVIILMLITFTVIRCVYKIKYFDKYIFEDIIDTSIPTQLTFYLSHFIFYIPFGILYSFDILPIIMFKIIIYNFILQSIENCNIYSVDNIDTTILCSIVDILGYIFGAMIYVSMLKK